MRVSEYYGLNRTQADLDFVDVNVHGDMPVFVDPRALLSLNTAWGHQCVSLIQDFFSAVLGLIRSGQDARAHELLCMLREPNETRLGLSTAHPRGQCLGEGSALKVYDSLSTSEAVRTGLLEDLEDTVLMVEGISHDKLSDIATNIIRGPLIGYTQDACSLYGIPMVKGVSSGSIWDDVSQGWQNANVHLPIVDGNKKLLLVPKAIVRRRPDYDPDEYYRGYMLNHLIEVELSNPNSQFVVLLRDRKGRVRDRKVYKKDLVKYHGSGKTAIVSLTRQYPEVLDRYRFDKGNHVREPLSNQEFADIEEIEEMSLLERLEMVEAIPAGNANAKNYEEAIEKLLTPLLYPCLSHPQFKIHDGRKRIDITYDNNMREGFFDWVARHYPAPFIFVECKNYNGDPGNPELDQLSGRFSPSRGRVGLLVCRRIEDKNLFLQRCRDTAVDDRGFIIPLDDHDLRRLVETVVSTEGSQEFPLLMNRFRVLIS